MKYKNEATGLNVITGTVKEVTDGVAKLEAEFYVKGNKEAQKGEFEILNVPADLKAGFKATVVGYQQGTNRYSAEAVLTGNQVYENGDLCVIHGFIARAGRNEEKDADGNAKVTKDGKPRAPHYDICINVGSGEDRVSHRIKVYNSSNDQDAIDRCAKQFSGLGKEREENGKKTVASIVGTFITQAGNSYTIQNGEYVNNYSDHLGLSKCDFEYINREVKEQEKTAKTQEATQEEKGSSGDGFMNIPDGIDEELPFDN